MGTTKKGDDMPEDYEEDDNYDEDDGYDEGDDQDDDEPVEDGNVRAGDDEYDAHEREEAQAQEQESPAAVAVADPEPEAAPAEADKTTSVVNRNTTISYFTDDTVTPERALLMGVFISEALLKEISGLEEIDRLQLSGPAGDSEEVIEMWVVPSTIIDKLKERRYTVDRVTKLRVATTGEDGTVMEVIYSLPTLLLPDGALASSAVDPLNYIIYKETCSAMRDDRAAPLKTVIDAYLRAEGVASRSIYVLCSGGRVTSGEYMNKTDSYVIEFCGSPLSSRDNYMTVPRQICGETAPNRNDNYSIATALHMHPITDEAGTEIGCLGPNGIFFYYFNLSIGWFSDESTMRMLTKAFECAKAARTLSSAGKDNFEAGREKYIKYGGRRVRSMKEDTDNEVKELNKHIEEAQQNLISIIQSRESKLSTLAALEKDANHISTILSQEYDSFKNLDRVVRMYWRGAFLCADTTVINVTDPRTNHIHELGEFTICLNCETSVPRFFNRTRRVRGYNPDMMAPHVWADGTACLGNLDGILPRLIGSGKLYQAMLCCLSFLDSVNVDDPAGRNTHRWPIRKMNPNSATLDNSGPLLSA